MEYLEIEEILPNPFQPRIQFDEEELTQLAKSIAEYGIIEPLIVRINNNDEFELIAGERRLKAAKIAGLKKVPVILKDYDDRKTAQIALIENLQRSDLNALEEANAYQVLSTKFCLTQEEIARKVGKSRSYIANFLRLLNLSDEVKVLLIEDKLTMGQAKPLLAIKDEKLQLELAILISEQELSARKAEALVKKALANEIVVKEEQQKPIDEQIYFDDVKEKLKRILGTNVNIKQGKKKSRLEIEFYHEEDLMRLVDLLLDNKEHDFNKEISSSKTIKNFSI